MSNILKISPLSRDLYTISKLSKNLILAIFQDNFKPTDVITYDQYASLYKIQHDAIHWLICDYRELPFGEKPISDFKLSESVYKHKYWRLVEKQTPDIFIINNNKIKITELTISRMKQPDIPKITKYSMLVNLLKECGYDVEIEVIVINSIFSVPDQSLLRHEYHFNQTLIDQIYIVIKKITAAIQLVHETDKGAEWFAKWKGLTMEEIDFGLIDDEIMTYANSLPNKPFNSISDLKDQLTSTENPDMTDNDHKFIDFLVEKAKNVDTKLTKSQNLGTAINSLIEFHNINSTTKTVQGDDDLRSYMPLPYFENCIIDSAKRSTNTDIADFNKIKGLLSTSPDSVLRKIGEMDGVMSRIKLTSVEKFRIALSGPGRKQYIMKGSEPHVLSQRKRKNYWINLNFEGEKHIENISFELSQVDSTSDTSDLKTISGLGLNYIKVCQSIFREININALRKDRRRNFIIKPTGVEGVFVVLFPGPKLRTGENLSIVWFKVILNRDLWKYHANLSKSWIFKKLLIDPNVLHSDWLSTDAHRLDHYIRSYDKILMSYCCYISLSNNTIQHNFSQLGSNTLGMIIMIYMENKRSTSKMLQDARYLIMTVLSLYNYFQDVFDKFKEPLRTPLQSYLLNKMINFIKTPNLKNHVLSTDFGQMNIDASTGDVFDRLAGSKIQLPRLLTTGSLINFKQMLCEMYFTMLFNKNQDDPTHASFQILSKILEGEASLKEVKQKNRLHTGFDVDDISDAEYLIDNPHKNQFSRRAIIISSKLQSNSKYNRANSGVAHRVASHSSYINKTLDEFATFKSSSTLQNSFLNPEVYVMYQAKKDQQEKDEKDLKITMIERNVQNRRRRCLEGVAELISKGYLNSFDLIKPHIYEPIHFQIFKKNQIGGVREIVILDIYKRILINILESFSRVICHDDDREMLTHGDKKITLMRDLIRDLKRGEGKKAIMNYNFDKTKWAPSFMPIQFLYMFVPFRKYYPSLFQFILVSLINHTNKSFLLPEKLIRSWMNDPLNMYTHNMDHNLQSLKEEFLKTKRISYSNESNMGQGILHYTSSYFHLCLISLRDEIYNRLCISYNIPPGEWRDLVSSDDSYTAHALPLDNKLLVTKRIELFLKAQEVTERVMNAWTSTSKSSISLLIYEFNSLFGSNLTMYPTTLKFAIASVHPVNTDSFFRMVKESYIACRQVVENGGSLELYEIASKLNKDYCESIYHTHQMGQNDLYQFGLRPSFTPYQLGVYPLMDPAIMIMFGPECHNYAILQNMKHATEVEKHMFQISHSMVETSDPEVYSSVNNIDNVFVGVHRIEAHVGQIKILEAIKRTVDFSWADIHAHILRDPLILFNPPINIDELKVKVFSKLYQNSAAEALRTTAASIYYGRVSASVSAKAFTIPFFSLKTGEELSDESKKTKIEIKNLDPQKRMTFSECIKMLLNTPVDPIDMSLLYPHSADFDSISTLSCVQINYTTRDELETQNLRSLQLNKLQQRITNPIMDILNFYWQRDLTDHEVPTSYSRDWFNLTESLPIIKMTLHETLESFPGDKSSQIKSLILVILRLMGYSTKPMKAILFGPSSKAYDSTYLILTQQNKFHSSTSLESKGLFLTRNIVRKTDKLCFAYNYFFLSCYYKNVIDVSNFIDYNEVESFLMDNSLSPSSFKKILIMLLYHGWIDDVTSWSFRTKHIFHQWILRGSYENEDFDDFSIKLQLGYMIATCSYNRKIDKIKITFNKLDNLTFVKEIIDKMIELSSMTPSMFLSKLEKGHYSLTSDRLVNLIYDVGFKIYTQDLTIIMLNPAGISYESGFLVLYDEDHKVIFKTVEGLLHSDYTPDDKELKRDIKIQGISLKKLLQLRPFNTHFSIDHCSHTELCNLLYDDENKERSDDLKVEKPLILKTTNLRLGINWKTRDESLEFSEMFSDPSPIIEEEEKKESFDDFNLDAIIEQVKEFNDYDSLLKVTENIDFNNYHDIWLDPSIDINILKTITRQTITYQPKKMLEKVLSIKYQIIAKLLVNINVLNKKTIMTLYKMNPNKYLMYSLIYVYDKQYTDTQVPSPDGCEISVDSLFDKRYSIQQSDIILDI